MKNKKLLIGGAIVAGGLLFLYMRNKRKAENAEENPVDTGAGTGAGSGSGTGTGSGTGAGSASGSGTSTTTTTTPPANVTKLTNFEANARVLKACGVKPPSYRKQARNLWDDCKDRTKASLRQQGLISFNGLDEQNSSNLDFDGGIQD